MGVPGGGNGSAGSRLVRAALGHEGEGGDGDALLEDGIPVAPLPFIPKNRAN